MTIDFVSYRPPRIAMLLLAIAVTWQWLLPAPVLLRAPLAAALLGIAGFAMMMRAWWQFRQRRVAICPTEPTDDLITDGIYRLTRNPMYLGVVLMLAGVALGVGTLPFALAGAAFFLVIDLAFCPYEEAKLRATFGEDWVAYRNKVSRWL